MSDELPGLRNLSPAWLDRLSALWPERVALTLPDRGTRYSYRDLARRASSVAGGLARRGVRRGDRVAAIMQNGVEMLDLLLLARR